jgi:hypothetical protein
VAKLNIQLKPQEADIKISPNLIYNAMKFQLIRKWFTKSSVVATNLNLELRPQANEINISPNLIYVVITPLIDFEVIFLYVTKSCVSAAKLNLE